MRFVLQALTSTLESVNLEALSELKNNFCAQNVHSTTVNQMNARLMNLQQTKDALQFQFLRVDNNIRSAIDKHDVSFFPQISPIASPNISLYLCPIGV